MQGDNLSVVISFWLGSLINALAVCPDTGSKWIPSGLRFKPQILHHVENTNEKLHKHWSVSHEHTIPIHDDVVIWIYFQHYWPFVRGIHPSPSVTQTADLQLINCRLASRQWETSLQSNAVSHWLGANLESALEYITFVPLSDDWGDILYFKNCSWVLM